MIREYYFSNGTLRGTLVLAEQDFSLKQAIFCVFSVSLHCHMGALFNKVFFLNYPEQYVLGLILSLDY